MNHAPRLAVLHFLEMSFRLGQELALTFAMWQGFYAPDPWSFSSGQ